MAIQWGSWSGPTYEKFRVGVDLSVSGTKITAKYYVESEGRVIGDNALLTRTGTITGTKTFEFNAGTSGATMLVDTRTYTGSRGKTYTFGCNARDLYIGNSYIPSVSASVTVPALVPSTPSISSITGITTSKADVNYGIPNGNGAAVNGMQIQVSTSSSFSSTVQDYVDTNGSPASPGGLTANTTYYARIRARNSVGYSGWSAVKSFKTTPQAPAAPSAMTAGRVSDASHSLAWTRNATSAAPYDSLLLQRWDNVTQAWATIATLAGTATSYSDATTQADRRYQWRIQSKNAAASSAWTYSAFVDTTPATPTACTAAKVAADIVVTWTNAATQASAVEVWHQPGSGAWELLATVAAGSAASYQHVAPSNAVTHTYRVRAKSASPVLYSGYATSQVVQLAAPPNAPTITGPLGAVDPGLGIAMLSWRHNPVDSSRQSKYQIQHRLKGATSWTVEAERVSSSSEAPLWQIDPSFGYVAGNTIEWQVRTWGVHASPSPYSATGTIVLSATPTVAINSPGPVATEPRLTVQWGYYQEQGSAQGQWQAELVNANGATVEALSGSGATTSATFARLLPDTSAWTVRVRARSGAGLWSEWTVQAFKVDYPEPVRPIASADWQPDTGSIEVGIDNPPSAGDSFTLTNLFANPDFETASGTVEVARNSFPDPNSTGVNNFGGFAGGAGTTWVRRSISASWSASGKAASAEITAAPSSTAPGDMGPFLAQAPVGERWTVVFRFVINRDTAVTLGLGGSYGNAQNHGQSHPGGASIPVAKGVPITFWVTFTRGDTSVADTRARVRPNDIYPGDVWQFAEVDLYPGDYQPNRQWFSGDYSPDPDLTPSWTGGVNATPSVLTGAGAAYVPNSWPTRFKTIQSSQWSKSGTKSVRVIPLQDGSNAGSFAEFAITGLVIGQTYTLAAWAYLPAPLTGPLNALSRKMAITGTTPPAVTEITSVPNEEGEHILRASFVASETSHTIRLFNGAKTGGGDMYWDMVTPVRGLHRDLMPFTGRSPSETTEDGYAIVYSWDGTVDASTSTASYGPAPEAVSNSIYRQIDDGEWVLIAEDVPPNGVYVDPIPSIAGVNRYKAVAWTDAPAQAESVPVDVLVAEPGFVYLNWGPGFGEFVRWYGNIKLSGSTSRERTLHQFAGRKKPVPFFGEAREQKVSLSGRLTPDSSSLYDLEDAVNAAEVVCLRDPKGRRMFGVTGSLSHQWEGPHICQVGIEIEEVDYDE